MVASIKRYDECTWNSNHYYYNQIMNIIITDMKIIRLNIKYLSSDKYFIALGGIG